MPGPCSLVRRLPRNAVSRIQTVSASQPINANAYSYLQACVKEALRIFSPVPMQLPRVAPKGGLKIGDRTIAQGTIVSVSPWAIHHSKEIWGEDVHQFRPERWLGEDAAAKEKYWIPVSRQLFHRKCYGTLLTRSR